MFFKDFVSVKRQKIKRGASQTYDTPSRVEKIIKYEQYQLNSGLNVEFDFIQPSLNTEAGTGLVDVREITMT